MFTLAIILCIALYLVVGGISFAKLQNAGKEKCDYRECRQCDSMCGHFIWAGLSVIIWPVVLPIAIGVVLGQRESRQARRDRKLLEEAEFLNRMERELGLGRHHEFYE